MIKLQVLITKKLYYGNSWGIYGCETVNPSDRKLVKLNTYGNFTIKGNMYDELIEGRKYVIEIEDEIEKSSRGESYNLIKVHIPKLTSSETQYDFLSTIVTETQYQNIVKKFPPKSKLKIIDAIRNDEIDLTTVYGIGVPTADKIKTTVIEKEELIHLFNKLTPLGVKPNTINKIVEHYKTPQRALNKINQSLYNLCEVKGLGFITVDKYAIEGGEQVDGFKRMEACVNYLVHEFAKEGHSWTSIEEMKVEANKLLNIDSYHLDVFLGSLDLQDSEETNLLDVFNGQITNKYYYKIEKEVYENLHRINDNYKNRIDKSKLDKAIQSAQDKLGVEYTEEQVSTIINSFNEGVYIINGKSGTGKSTIMKGITEICDALGLSYKAVSLSGRAAQLLTLKGIEASTIHRLLGYKGKSFMHNEEFPLSQDVIILEEASMDNAYLWHSVLIAMKDGAKLIIVGDSGQLPAIGNGDVLRDLINNPMFKKFELQQIHRQAQDSGIIEVAGKIREGENITGYNWQLSNSYGVNEDLFIFTFNDREVLHNKAKSIITKQMNKLDSDTIMDFQILVANKSRGELSAVSINNLCQSIYNDLSKESVKNYVYEFRVDDKVIVSGNKYKVHMYNSINDYKKNNPIGEYNNLGDFIPTEHSLYNGTIGIVVAVDTSKDNYSCLVKFEGFDGYIKIEKEELKDLDLAYAITIHRGQGMSIQNTLFLLDQSAYKLLSRQLVYTAITRASKKCVVLAENNALNRAVSQDNSGLRRTFVGQFIQQES